MPGPLKTDFLFRQPECIGTHLQNRNEFAVSLYFSLDVRKFLRFGKGFALRQFAQVLVHGDKDVLNVFDITEILIDQNGKAYSATTLKVIVPSAGCGFPFGMN